MAKDGVEVSGNGFKTVLRMRSNTTTRKYASPNAERDAAVYTNTMRLKLKQSGHAGTKTPPASAAFMAANAHQPKVKSLPSGR